MWKDSCRHLITTIMEQQTSTQSQDSSSQETILFKTNSQKESVPIHHQLSWTKTFQQQKMILIIRGFEHCWIKWKIKFLMERLNCIRCSKSLIKIRMVLSLMMTLRNAYSKSKLMLQKMKSDKCWNWLITKTKVTFPSTISVKFLDQICLPYSQQFQKMIDILIIISQTERQQRMTLASRSSSLKQLDHWEPHFSLSKIQNSSPQPDSAQNLYLKVLSLTSSMARMLLDILMNKRD